MAIPTITSLSPATGLTSGRNMVWINGTNFRLPPTPGTGYQGGDEPRTVQVKFNGVVSSSAYAATTAKILAVVPAYTGTYDQNFPVSVSVRVANLDDNEVEIPTENVTKTNAYAYGQPVLTDESRIQRVTRVLIKFLRLCLLKNTHNTSSRDYDRLFSDTEGFKATLPVVHLIGPTLSKNVLDSSNGEDEEVGPGANDFFKRAESIAADVTWDVEGFTRADSGGGSRELMSLMQAFMLAFRDKVTLVMDIDGSNPAAGSHEYEVEIPWEAYPCVTSVPGVDDIRAFRSQIIVRGLQIDSDGGTIIDRGWTIYAGSGEPTVTLEADLT
jgi:hypothetical protein